MTLLSDLNTASRLAADNGQRGVTDKQINFLASLMTQLGVTVAANVPLTAKDASGWIDTMLKDVKALPPKAPVKDDDVPDLTAVITLLADATAHIKYPKVHFENVNIVLALAGNRARFPGSVNVTSEGGYGNNDFFGRIHTDGRFEPSRTSTDKVKDFLINLSDDVVGTVKQHGKDTGNCSFCSRPLSDDKSVTAGYGPVCAKTYNLPYGG
jgi:hypothetical protein